MSRILLRFNKNSIGLWFAFNAFGECDSGEQFTECAVHMNAVLIS